MTSHTRTQFTNYFVIFQFFYFEPTGDAIDELEAYKKWTQTQKAKANIYIYIYPYIHTCIRSTCPPLSPLPHATSFIIGTAVINTHSQGPFACAWDAEASNGAGPALTTRRAHAQHRAMPVGGTRPPMKTCSSCQVI